MREERRSCRFATALSLFGGKNANSLLEIPAEALREALTNALCHRQLEKFNLTPSIAVYDDRVEIENPGRFPLALTPENIKSAHASYPYNPLIADVLFKSSFLESWGSGVRRMVDACHAQGVAEPEYEEKGGFVTIVFKRPVESGIIHSDSNSKPNGKELARSWQGVGKELGLDYKVLEIIGEYCREERSLAEIARHLGLADRYKMKKKYIDPLLGRYLEMTCPDSVNSPAQKYYLTEIGKALSDKE